MIGSIMISYPGLKILASLTSAVPVLSCKCSTTIVSLSKFSYFPIIPMWIRCSYYFSFKVWMILQVLPNLGLPCCLSLINLFFHSIFCSSSQHISVPLVVQWYIWKLIILKTEFCTDSGHSRDNPFCRFVFNNKQTIFVNSHASHSFWDSSSEPCLF